MSKRRRSIPVLTEAGDMLTCGHCEALCCRKGTAIPLSAEERQRNLLRFSVAVEIEPVSYDRELPSMSDQEPARLLPAGWGRYRFTRDCGNLTTDNACRVYDQLSPTRPQACENFEVGSVACLVLRAGASYQDQIPPQLQQVVAEGVEQLSGR